MGIGGIFYQVTGSEKFLFSHSGFAYRRVSIYHGFWLERGVELGQHVAIPSK